MDANWTGGSIAHPLQQFLSVIWLCFQPPRSFLLTVNAIIKCYYKNLENLETWRSISHQAKGIFKLMLKVMSLSTLEPPLSEDLSFFNWTSVGKQTIGTSYECPHLASFQTLHRVFKIGHKDFYKYLRIRHIATSFTWSESSLTLETLRLNEATGHTLKGLSCFSKLVTRSLEAQKLSSIAHSKTILHIAPDLTQWHCALTKLLIYSKCINHWETVQKISHNWYYTPTKIDSIYPDASPTVTAGDSVDWGEPGYTSSGNVKNERPSSQMWTHLFYLNWDTSYYLTINGD